MKLAKRASTRQSRKTSVITSSYSQERIIRLCRECVHYSNIDDTCKVLSIINNVNMDVTRIKSIHCRTREDLCGMNARYYEYQEVQTTPTPTPSPPTPPPQEGVVVQSVADVFEDEVFNVTYYIDGSVGVNTDEASVDNYYDTLHHDFNDVY